MTKTERATEVEISEIPEVAAFVAVQNRLSKLRQEYPGLFDEIDDLAEQYNTTLEAADKAVRAKEVSCGPFTVRQYVTKYDANELFNAVGKEKFLALGGSVQTVHQYDIDKKLFDAAAAQGKVSKTVFEAVKTTSPTYNKQGKIFIP